MFWYALIGFFIGFIVAFYVVKTSINGAQGNLKLCKKCPYVIQNEVPEHLKNVKITAEDTEPKN